MRTGVRVLFRLGLGRLCKSPLPNAQLCGERLKELVKCDYKQIFSGGAITYIYYR